MFAPLVILVRKFVGDERKFRQVRGNAIALHSKAITNFCNRVGIERSQRQKMIRIARDNGKRLGLLA